MNNNNEPNRERYRPVRPAETAQNRPQGRPNSQIPPQNRRPNPNGQQNPNIQGANRNPRQPYPQNMSREEYMRRLEAERRVQQQGGNNQRHRRKRRRKPNIGIMLFAVMICGVIGVSAYHISKNPIENKDFDNKIQDNSKLPDNPDNLETKPESNLPEGEVKNETDLTGPEKTEPDKSSFILCDTYTVNSADINTGDLILVNYERFYSLADTVSAKSVYENKTSNYNVSTTNIKLTDKALDALNGMADAFASDTGLREILIVSGYRNTEEQQSIYDSRVESHGEEYAKTYVAVPGYSEHHTGLACDLSFFNSDGASIPISDHEYGYWINEHCAEYGYILRYPDAKVDITKIGYEPWHYRYVGKPHAAVIMKQGICLEEYIDYVKGYTIDTKLMHAAEDGTVTEISVEDAASNGLPKTGWIIYYVPASDGESTEIKVPAVCDEYTVSGNNVDGFIVTAALD